jgi:hypothetical protein
MDFGVRVPRFHVAVLVKTAFVGNTAHGIHWRISGPGKQFRLLRPSLVRLPARWHRVSAPGSLKNTGADGIFWRSESFTANSFILTFSAKARMPWQMPFNITLQTRTTSARRMHF